ncbi:MAG TPA: hypothetical protein VK870_14985 [Ignavibacteriaceae bacterium]|nr:hypothetical protein [Ignavibacteriaceae bacterium]
MNAITKKFLLIFCLLFFYIFSNSTFAQHLFKVNEDIGGGSPSAQVSQSDDSMMYIVGGAIIIGIIVYAVLRDKKVKTVEEDSTSAFNNSDDIFQTLSMIQKNTDYKNPFPIDLYMGLQRIINFSEDRQYVFGLRLNL